MGFGAHDVAAHRDVGVAAPACPLLGGGNQARRAAGTAMRSVDDEAENLAVTIGLEQLTLAGVHPADRLVPLAATDEHHGVRGVEDGREATNHRVAGGGITQLTGE